LIPAGFQVGHLRPGLITLGNELLVTSRQFSPLLGQPLLGFGMEPSGVGEGSPASHREKAQSEAESPVIRIPGDGLGLRIPGLLRNG